MKTEHPMNNPNYKTLNKISPTKNETHPKRKQKSMHRKTNSQFFGFEDLQLLNLDTQSSHRPFSAAHLSDNNNNNAQTTTNNNVNILIQNINVDSTTSNDEDQLNSSVIIKDSTITDQNVVDKSTTKNVVMTKSFIPLVNTLKYVRDKEENATESYLLALGLEKEEKNKDYNVGSIIEEEKSDLLISESDFSSKKKILAKYGTSSPIKHFDGVNINLNRSKFEQMFKSNNNNNKNTITSNKVIFSGSVSIKEHYNTNSNSNNNRINLTLNEMIKRKEEKDKNYRNQLTNNKMCLLNTFYTLTNANHNGNQSNSNDNNNNNIGNVIISSSKHLHTKDEHNKLTHHQQIISSYPKKQNKINKSSNSTTISFNDHSNTNSIKNTKKIRRTLSQNINSIYNNNNNNNNHYYYSNRSSYKQPNKELDTTRQINEAILKNNNINIKIHHSKSKSKDKAIISFPNTNDISSTHNIDSITLKQKLIVSHNKNQTVDLLALNEELTSVNTIPLKNLHYHIKKKTIADLTQITSDNKEHVPITKHKHFSNALTLIQSQRNSKSSIHNNSNINIPNNNNSNCNSNSNSHYISNTNTNNNTSANTNSNTRTYTRSNSRSSRTKDNKNDINSNNGCCFKKTKSQSYLNHIVPVVVNNGNYFQTANTLKNKLVYSKTYEKKDVLDKILSSTSNGYYLIMCYNNNHKKQNERNNTCGVIECEFMFLGLFKYYNIKERFIKIYGNEKCQNIIPLKQLTTSLNDVFDIYVVDTNNTMFYIQSKYAFNDKSYVILKTKAQRHIKNN